MIMLFREEGVDRDLKCPHCSTGFHVEWSAENGEPQRGLYRRSCPECGQDFEIEVGVVYRMGRTVPGRNEP